MNKAVRSFSLRKSTIFIAGYTLYLLFIIFVLDAAYKLFFEKLPPLRGEVYLQMHSPSIHQRSEIEGLFYELKPNSANKNLKINSLGMRDHEPPLAKDSYRVLVMGDSVTFGAEVKQNQLFTKVAEKVLEANNKKIEILNAGVNCYNTKQEFIALKEKYLKLRPDLVIFAFCSNDLGEAAIQYLPDDYVQRKTMEMPNNFHYNNLSDIQYLSLALPKQFLSNYRLDRWLLLNSSIYRTLSILKFKKRYGINDLANLPNFLFGFNFNEVLSQILKLSMDKGFQVIFLILPTMAEWNKKYVVQALAENKITFWDIDLTVQEIYGEDADLWIAPKAAHLNPEGHLIVGKLLADNIKRLLIH